MTVLPCLLLFLLVPGSDELDLLNAQREKIGLPAFVEDPELAEIAAERLAANLKRGDWRHNRLGGRMVGRFKPARVEGCGKVTSSTRWYTCFWRSRKHKFAGAARVKVGNRYWQLLLLR